MSATKMPTHSKKLTQNKRIYAPSIIYCPASSRIITHWGGMNVLGMRCPLPLNKWNHCQPGQNKKARAVHKNVRVYFYAHIFKFSYIICYHMITNGIQLQLQQQLQHQQQGYVEKEKQRDIGERKGRTALALRLAKLYQKSLLPFATMEVKGGAYHG